MLNKSVKLMDTNAIFIALGLIVFGTIVFITGLRIRFNGKKTWFLVPNYYVLLPKGTYYAMPLMGLMLIFAGISLFMPTQELVRQTWLWGVFPTGFFSVLVVITQPKWFKPKWVRWMEDNHGDILEILIEEGRMTPDWGETVSSQEGLEAWVKKVKKKRGIK
jgi:hypothetical protein